MTERRTKKVPPASGVEPLLQLTGDLRNDLVQLAVVRERVNEEITQLGLCFIHSDRYKQLGELLKEVDRVLHLDLQDLKQEDLERLAFDVTLSDRDLETVARQMNGLWWLLSDALNGEDLRKEWRDMFPEDTGAAFVYTLSVDDVSAIYDQQVEDSVEAGEWAPEVAASMPRWKELTSGAQEKLIQLARTAVASAAVGEAIGTVINLVVAEKERRDRDGYPGIV